MGLGTKQHQFLAAESFAGQSRRAADNQQRTGKADFNLGGWRLTNAHRHRDSIADPHSYPDRDGNSHSNPDSDPHVDPDRNSHADGDANSNLAPDSHLHADVNADIDSYFNSDCHADSEFHSGRRREREYDHYGG